MGKVISFQEGRTAPLSSFKRRAAGEGRGGPRQVSWPPHFKGRGLTQSSREKSAFLTPATARLCPELPPRSQPASLNGTVFSSSLPAAPSQTRLEAITRSCGMQFHKLRGRTRAGFSAAHVKSVSLLGRQIGRSREIGWRGVYCESVTILNDGKTWGRFEGRAGWAGTPFPR